MIKEPLASRLLFGRDPFPLFAFCFLLGLATCLGFLCLMPALPFRHFGSPTAAIRAHSQA